MKNCSRTKPFFKCLNCVQTLENKMYLKFTRQTEKKKKKENWINSSNERVVSIRFWSTFLRRVSRVQKKKKKKIRVVAPNRAPLLTISGPGNNGENSNKQLLSAKKSAQRLVIPTPIGCTLTIHTGRVSRSTKFFFHVETRDAASSHPFRYRFRKVRPLVTTDVPRFGGWKLARSRLKNDLISGWINT